MLQSLPGRKEACLKVKLRALRKSSVREKMRIFLSGIGLHVPVSLSSLREFHPNFANGILLRFSFSHLVHDLNSRFLIISGPLAAFSKLQSVPRGIYILPVLEPRTGANLHARVSSRIVHRYIFPFPLRNLSVAEES
ncbi:hypothetical protein Tco_1449174 [Tanacetum coccineum]